MKVVGLDIATTTGVCLGHAGQAPEFFSRDLGHGQPHQLRFANILRLTHELVSDHGVEFIGIEAPIMNSKRDSRQKLELLYGLIASVRGWAELKKIPCQTFEIRTLDKTFIGHAGFPRDDRKRANLTRCKQLGWKPNPLADDEADAGSVYYSSLMKCGVQMMPPGGLF